MNDEVEVTQSTYDYENSPFDSEPEELRGKRVIPTPRPKPNIGIDTENHFAKVIINASDNSSLDLSAIESFTNIARRRDTLYQLLDTMCEDSTISAVIETYAEDCCQYNDNGRIMWAESPDADVAKYVNFLLDALNVDKHLYDWTQSLCKYGDLYLHLYRQSEYVDPIFNETSVGKERLDESVILKQYLKEDKFANYIEKVSNPAEVFELTKFGKTVGYIKAPISTSTYTNDSINNYSQYHFNLKSEDVELYPATEFVHAALEDNSSRSPEVVYLTNDDSTEYAYSVKRGQSLLYNQFKTWRELMLLQNAVLLNRLTKSSIVRVVGVEIGDMAPEEVPGVLQKVKSLIEQKSALKESVAMAEYTNPGPIENNVYVPTREGKGSITTTQVGGDVDVKSLADLEYYRDLLFAGLRVPKQFFNFTDDAAGFNGGTSLTIISSRYGKMIKRIQNTVIQVITDAINILLLDRKQYQYLNNFTLKMVPPTTQEELDRREALQNSVQVTSDIMNLVSDFDDPIIQLKILKALLANSISNDEVTKLIQDYVDDLEKRENSSNEEVADEAENLDLDFEEGGSSTPSSDHNINISTTPSEDQTEPTEPNEASEEEEINLPSPNELGDIDFTDNTQSF